MGNANPLDDGVFIVRCEGTSRTEVALSLAASKKIVLDSLGIQGDVEFQWYDWNKDHPSWMFGKDQGAMEAHIEGSVTGFFVEWKSIQTAE